MKVALVNPPQPNLVQPGLHPPLGVACVASATRKAHPSIATDLLDFAAETPEGAAQALAGYDVVAFTATSLDYHKALAVAGHLRQPGRRLAIGGPHATLASIEDAVWDVVFKGEGEATFPKYLEDLQTGVPAKAYRGEPIKPLDALPFAARELRQGPCMREDCPSATVMGSRGCVANCAFCASPALWPGPVRYRSPESVVREMDLIRQTQGIASFALFDENVTCNRAWLTKFCRLVKPLGLRWRAQSRVTRVDAALFGMMAKAGCREIDFGVESFDQDVLDALKKGTTVAQNVNAIQDAAEAGLDVRIFLMIGTPGESGETVGCNIDSLAALGDAVAVLDLYTLTPLPGTAIRSDPARFGVNIISDDFAEYNRHQWRMGGESTWSPLRVLAMSAGQQRQNAERMHTFAASHRAVNKGQIGAAP